MRQSPSKSSQVWRIRGGVILAVGFALALLLPAPRPAAAAPVSSAIVIDVASGQVLLQSNADITTYPASLTKMMTLYLLFEALQKGAVKLGEGEFLGLAPTTRGGKLRFIWGNTNMHAEELGIGASDLSLVPVSVSGGLRFSAVDAGWRYHTCGLTTSGAAYCWGFNVWGQLGNGSTENTAVPAAVSGGLTFAGLSAGGTNSCGVTSPGFVYCWGDHLGKASAVPARVDGQQ